MRCRSARGAWRYAGVSVVMALSCALGSAPSAIGDSVGADPGQGVILKGVAVVGQDDVWVAGVNLVAEGGRGRGMVLQWDGNRWTRSLVLVPYTYLSGVSASGPDDVWVVGSYFTGGEPKAPVSRAVIAHWDGDGWHRVTAPVCYSGGEVALESVVALAPDAAWAVGASVRPDGKASRPVVLGWDGDSWACATLPGVARRSLTELSSVTAAGLNDVQTAGFTSRSAEAHNRSYVLRWDGHTWSREHTPNSPQVGATLLSISSCGHGCAWATGYQVHDQTTHALVVREVDGRWHQFSVDPSDDPDDDAVVLALSPRDAWIVGSQRKRSGWPKPLALHWTGSGWQSVDAPSDELQSGFGAAGAAGPRDVWAVGAKYDRSGAIHALAEQWNGHTWRIR